MKELKASDKVSHYKGGKYTIVGEALHSETKEPLVVYSDTDGRCWARPKDMFLGSVKVDGKEVPRFKKE